ncbi:MAG: GGDEF domain-containing protein, partial [Janthinobacterium lividum]
PVALIGIFQDITSQYAMEQALRHAADTDELTGLASRGRCNQVIDDSIAVRRERDEPLALLLIDLDHFKSVNDRFGHPAGDDLLQLITSRLRQSYLGGSFAARIGGDEFILLVTCSKLLADLPGLLQQLLSDLRHSVRDGGGIVDISATIGVAWLDRDNDDRLSLMRRADAALYEGKRARRGSAVIAGDDEHIVTSGPCSPALRLVN